MPTRLSPHSSCATSAVCSRYAPTLTGLMRMPSSMCAESAWSETLCAITSLSHSVLTKVVLPARAPETGQPWLWLCCSAAGPAARRTGAGCADDHQAGKGKGAAVSTRRHRDAQGRAGSKPAHQNETPFFVARRMRDVMMGRGWRGGGSGCGSGGKERRIAGITPASDARRAATAARLAARLGLRGRVRTGAQRAPESLARAWELPSHQTSTLALSPLDELA
jgi:hypothetical protein